MLKDHDSSAILAVANLDRAHTFYGDVLGLDLAPPASEQTDLQCRKPDPPARSRDPTAVARSLRIAAFLC